VLADALVTRDLLAAESSRDEHEDLRLPLGETGRPRALSDDCACPGPTAEPTDQQPADVETEHANKTAPTCVKQPGRLEDLVRSVETRASLTRALERAALATTHYLVLESLEEELPATARA